jgi:hypothetical protein
MLFLLPRFSVGYEFYLTNDNVVYLVNQSHHTPVFLLVFSPQCGHCRMIHPAWRECMARFARTPGVVVAEANIDLYRNAISTLARVDSWPSFFDLVRGKATRVSPKRDLESFLQHAEELRREFSGDDCRYYVPGLHPFPAFVFSVANASCALSRPLCEAAGLPRDACLLSWENESNSYRLTVHFDRSVAVRVNATDASELLVRTKEFLSNALTEWDTTEALTALRTPLLVVYESRMELVNITKALRILMADFLIRKVSAVRYRRSSIGGRFPVGQTPAFLVADKARSRFYAVLEGWDPDAPLREQISNATLLPEDRATALEAAFETAPSVDWFWVLFAVSSAMVWVGVFCVPAKPHVEYDDNGVTE